MNARKAEVKAIKMLYYSGMESVPPSGELMDRDMVRNRVRMGISPDLETALMAAGSASKYLFDRCRERSFHPQNSPSVKVTKPDGTINIPEDIVAQSIIVSVIRGFHEKDGILAEEGIAEGLDRERVWLVDGIDGTREFDEGTWRFAVSVGLVERGQWKLGVIQHANEIWSVDFAERGKGAYHSNFCPPYSHRMRVTPKILAGGFRFVTHRSILAVLEGHPLAPHCTTLGSAALHQSFVARGLYNGYFSWTLNPWDAVGTILVEEAGGRVTDWQGDPRNPMSRDSILATNGVIHDELIQTLGGIVLSS